MNSSVSLAPPDAVDSPIRIHSAGGLAWGAFFGGPLALAYLVYRDLDALGRTDLLPKAAAWLVPFTAVWLYCLLSGPPDPISQWILYFPQTLVWWLVVRRLFADVRAGFASGGGVFLPRRKAVRFGVFTFLGLKVVFFGVAVLDALWRS